MEGVKIVVERDREYVEVCSYKFYILCKVFYYFFDIFFENSTP
jgi:hypothetical protein